MTGRVVHFEVPFSDGERAKNSTSRSSAGNSTRCLK